MIDYHGNIDAEFKKWCVRYNRPYSTETTHDAWMAFYKQRQDEYVAKLQETKPSDPKTDPAAYEQYLLGEAGYAARFHKTTLDDNHIKAIKSFARAVFPFDHIQAGLLVSTFAYLNEVPDYQLINSPIAAKVRAHLKYEPPPMELPKDLPFRGTYVLAAQGYGKSTLLSKLILDLMKEPCSIIVFDSKPELSLWLRDYKLPKQTVVIEPDPYLALNPLDLGTHNLDVLMYVFSGLLGAAFTELQAQALRQCVYLTSKIPNATFNTFFDVVINGGKNYKDIVATLDFREQDFWSRYDKEYASTKSQILWRLDLLTPPDSRARTMFAAPKTQVRMAPLMDTNTLTIIDNSLADLGEMQSEFFSRLFLTMILAAADQRSKSHVKHPCYVFMDEAHTVIHSEPRVADIIYRLRSQKVAFLAAHQSLSQIKEPQVISALADCAIRYVNAKNDAPAMAQHMGVQAEFIRSLGVGEFALSLQGQPAQRVKIPLPQWTYPKLTEQEKKIRHEKFRADYCYSPASPPAPRSATSPPALPPSDDDWGTVV